MNVALLFPGQASQFVGMGTDYIHAEPGVARRVDQAAECLGLDLRKVIARGPRNDLAQTHVAQVAIYALSVAIAELLAARGLGFVAVAGHSLGQFSALVAAEAMRYEDGLALVTERGRLMHAQNLAVDGSMFAVAGLALDAIERALDGIGNVWVANLNAADQVVLSGLRPALHDAQQRLVAAGGKVTWLDVAGPYHTPLFAEAAERFTQSVQRVALRDAAVPLVANSTASALVDADAIRAELRGHMLQPVRWSQTMHRMHAMGVDLLVEAGPGRVLKGLGLRNVPEIRCLGTSTLRDFAKACAALQEKGLCASS